MEITDIDKKFISKYEEIDLDFVTIKTQIVLLGILFIFPLIMIPIHLSDQNLSGANNCVVALIVYVPFLIYFGYSFICTKDLFIKELGVNERNAKQKYDFLKNEIGHFPFIRQICLLNPSAKTRQLELLKKWYVVNADVVNTYVYDIEYDEKTVEEELDKLNNKKN